MNEKFLKSAMKKYVRNNNTNNNIQNLQQT